jgi:CRISPR-associated protein Cas5h
MQGISMQGILFRVSGRWAHFKKPDTNNTPLTHDFITKTAMLGLMGAVLGIERREMRELFPRWSESFLYGVRLENKVRKESWSFTLRYLSGGQSPKPLEFLRDPDFTVALAAQTDDAQNALQNFARFLEEERAHFTPILGLHNCPAALKLQQRGEWQRASGAYSTQGFALRSQKLKPSMEELSSLRVGFERIPTFQNNDFWNLPDRYEEVVYPDAGGTISLEGEHFRFSDGSNWSLV